MHSTCVFLLLLALSQAVLHKSQHKLKHTTLLNTKAHKTKSKTQQSNVIYVKKDASGLNDGSSWTNAYTDLQDALADATSSQEIWVARTDSGGYFPTSGDDRTIAFEPKNGVNLYGGFSGDETSKTDRYWVSQTPSDWDGQDASSTPFTVLNGDIGESGSNGDNSYHVLSVTGSSSISFTLDGFYITNGYANGKDENGDGAGALFLGPESTDGQNPIIKMCKFKDNTAVGNGGAIHGWNYFFLELEDSSFEDNNAQATTDKSGNGGAISCVLGCNAVIKNTRFIQNLAEDQGGAIAIDYGYETYILNSYFENNKANHNGGAIFAIDRASQLGKTDVTIDNCNFISNQAELVGGAIVGWDSATLMTAGAQSTFTDNSAADGNSLTCLDCIMSSSYNDFGVNSDDYYNSELKTPETSSDKNNLDAAKNTMKGYVNLEYSDTTQGSIIYVDQSATGQNDGSSWDNAFTSIPGALDVANSNDEVWVAGGEYEQNTYVTVPSYVSLFGSFDKTEDNPEKRTFENPTIVDAKGRSNWMIFMSKYSHVDGFIITGASFTQQGSFLQKGKEQQLLEKSNKKNKSKQSPLELIQTKAVTPSELCMNYFAGVGLGITAHFCIDQQNINNPNDIIKYPGSIANIVFYNMYASKGSGMYILSADFDMVNVAFYANGAEARGGGLAVDISEMICYDNCVFEENYVDSGKGGGVYLDWGPTATFVNSVFKKNSAGNGGGGIGQDGSGNLYLKDCLVTDNLGNLDGAGIYQGTYQPSAGASVNEVYLENTNIDGNECEDATNPEIYSWGYNTFDEDATISVGTQFSIGPGTRTITVTYHVDNQSAGEIITILVALFILIL